MPDLLRSIRSVVIVVVVVVNAQDHQSGVQNGSMYPTIPLKKRNCFHELDF